MNNQNQTSVDAKEIVNKLLNKLAVAEYNQTVLEVQIENLTAKNKQLKEAQKKEGDK